MTPTLVRQHLPHAGAAARVDLCARARDWSEIQERMLVPLYEAVYERVDVGPGTRLLGLGCG
ncbi:SAM-dependent methyltransferase, partial [Streptomyces sp. NPDC006356]